MNSASGVEWGRNFVRQRQRLPPGAPGGFEKSSLLLEHCHNDLFLNLNAIGITKRVTFASISPVRSKTRTL